MEFLSDIFALLFESGGADIGQETETFSPMAIFMRADITVKAVMVILAVMSLLSWAIIFDRWLTFRRLAKTGAAIERRIWRSDSLPAALTALGKKRGFSPHMLLFRAVMKACQGEEAVTPPRLARLLAVLSQRLLGPMGRGLDVLATIGATAPFIGLFGTVWGIMNSFQSIAASGDTSLAIIAPGIAEALFATALGLFAAIPAVIFYNRLGFMLRRYGENLTHFADELWLSLTRSTRAGREDRPV